MKVLNPTSGLPAWWSDKRIGNRQEIWPWGPVGFDYRTSRGLGETQTPVLEGTNRILCTQRPRRNDQWPYRRLNQNCLRVGGPPVEAWVSRGSTQGWGHWQHQARKAPLGINSLGGHINLTIEPIGPTAGSPQAKQLPGRECNPTHQQIWKC